MNSMIARVNRSPLFASTDLAELFDAMVGGVAPAMAAASAPSMPIDVVEDDEGITIRANVPGFAKDQVAVEFHEGVLTISATRPERAADPSGSSDAAPKPRPIVRERPTSSVRRALHLPDRVTGEGIVAELADGVLSVRLPYAPKPMPRRISVN